jgi:hypothetical protein
MVPPPGLGESDYNVPFNDAFDKISEAIGKAVDGFNTLVGRVNDNRWLLGPTLPWIGDNLDRVRDVLTEIIALAQRAYEHQLPVLALIHQSFHWVDQVKRPLSELSTATTTPDSHNLWYWTGAASSAYTAKAAEQRAAVDETVAKAEFISQWLFRIATANVDYAVQLAKVVTELAGQLVHAVVAAGTVFDIPWAIDTLAEMVGTIVTESLNTLLGIAQRFVDALGNVRDIASQTGDHSKLPGGAWPEAVRG